MTPQQIIGVGLRLFSLWLALTSIGYFSSIPAALSSLPMETGSKTTVAYALGGAYLLGAIVLWFFPMFVAHKLVPKTLHENYVQVPAYDLARVGCSLIGLWLLAKALPALVWLLFRGLIFFEAGSTFSSLAPEAKLDVSVAFFEALFALFLVIKSNVFAQIICRLSPPVRESEQ